MEALLKIHQLPPFDKFSAEYFPIVHDYPHLPIYCVVVYLAMVHLLPKVMENRPAMKLKTLEKYWNLTLAILSLIMFANIAPHILYIYATRGLHGGVCMVEEKGLWVGFQLFCAWLFTLTKVVELFDTFLLILQKKRVIFLHWYHHSSVLLYTWYVTHTHVPVGWVFLTVNALIHTFMYYYYYLRSCGIIPTWAKRITQIQLSQMVIGVFMSVCWAYYYLSGQCPEPYFNEHPIGVFFIFASVFMYATYFYLFWEFYNSRWIYSQNQKQLQLQQQQLQQQQQQQQQDTPVVGSATTTAAVSKKDL
eukprot:TRINITY_DN49_c0_g1_i3.p2 TRINITY_DN49_c0_g1~~TRINITY_DN49_c0_g1_i3.p2  ORF type:complete len:305 (+),score=141.22 TRINITY_DN49_c0_g1_i3:267-1181(+)